MTGRRMRRALALLGLLGAALLPARLAAQGVVYGASVGAELDSATSAALLREVDRASSRGLPTAPLLAKAREGRLKRAPGPRIRQAVSALAVRLDSARGALGPQSSADELVAGADALAAGAEPDALRAVRSAATPAPVNVPLGALTQLVASGVPARRATTMVVELLRRRASAAQLVAFGNAVELDVASGLPGEESATFRLRAASGADVGMALTAQDLSPALSPGQSSPRSSPPRRRP